MPIAQVNETKDGFQTLAGGMNSAVDPSLLSPAQFARGVNIVVRDGMPTTRPGFTQVAELSAGMFQGSKMWQLNSGHYLVYVAAGHAHVFDYSRQQDTDLGFVMDPSALCYFEQADEWMVVQDNVSRPLVLQYSGGGTFAIYGRNPPEVCLVEGSVMVYAHGRIHYVPKLVPTFDPAVLDDGSNLDVLPVASTVPGQMTFVSSDVRDSLNPEWVFRMSEHRVLNEGGALALPEELGFITAMAKMRGAQTGTGVGEVVVFAREGVCAFDLSFPRTQWKGVNLARVQFRGAGTVSPRSVVNANNDLLYVDTDSWVRRYVYDTLTLGGSGGNLSNLPISTPMGFYATTDDRLYREYASGAFVNNRYLWTLHGTPGGTFKGLGVLDTAHLAPITSQGALAFDGVWTGFDILQVLSGNIGGAAYLQLVARSGTDRNFLLAQDQESITDPDGTLIQSILVTRAYDWGDQLKMTLKELRYVHMRLTKIQTPIVMEVLYRPKGYPVWTSMGVRYVPMTGGGAQFRRVLKFAVNQDAVGCDPTSGHLLNHGMEFQFAIRWAGWCKIENFYPIVGQRDHPPEDVCEDDNSWGATLPLDEGLDDFEYSVELT